MDPEMPGPEERIQVADVESLRQAEAADERDTRYENSERGPEPSSEQTAAVKLYRGHCTRQVCIIATQTLSV
jgi:hypothetical protein